MQNPKAKPHTECRAVACRLKRAVFCLSDASPLDSERITKHSGWVLYRVATSKGRRCEPPSLSTFDFGLGAGGGPLPISQPPSALVFSQQRTSHIRHHLNTPTLNQLVEYSTRASQRFRACERCELHMYGFARRVRALNH